MFLILNKKAFTLVEMLVALAVSSIVIIATYASYDMVKTQYEKNVDIAQMHTSGRAIMRVIERDVRMAGFEYQSNNGTRVYGNISNPINIVDGGENGLDEIVIIYDRITDEAQQQAERIRITYSTAQWPTPGTVSRRGNRQRLYKQIDVIGRNGIAIEETGESQLMADFLEDLQFYNVRTDSSLYSGSNGSQIIQIWDPEQPINQRRVGYISGTGYADSLAFGPDGLLYSGSNGSQIIQIWDPEQPIGQRRVGYISGTGYADSLAFGPDGLLYSGSNGSQIIQIWDPEQPIGQRRVGYISGTGYTDSLAFGPDGLLYSGSNGSQIIQIWDPEQPIGQRRVGYISGTGYTDSLAFGPDGLLYSGSNGSQIIQIWDPEQPIGQRRVGYISGTGYTDSLAFGPDGLLYSGSNGSQIIQIWDPEQPINQRRVGYIRGTGYADSLAFKNETTGQESLVNIKLTLRSKNKQHTVDTSYTKEVNEEHHIGNYNFEFDDKYKRDVFFSTVAVRNMLL